MAGTDIVLYTVLLPTTLRWIVTQKITINLANKYNKLKTSSCLKKICEQCEGAQLKKKVQIQVDHLEYPQDIGKREQFDTQARRERQLEGFYLTSHFLYNCLDDRAVASGGAQSNSESTNLPICVIEKNKIPVYFQKKRKTLNEMKQALKCYK